MSAHPTSRLCWRDDHLYDADAVALEIRGTEVAFEATPFYPGGGGQPADAGSATMEDGRSLLIATARADQDGVIWHQMDTAPPSDLLGLRARLSVDRDRRFALSRYHTVLHVLNTIALRDYGGWITGVQIGVDGSRIDFNLAGFSPAMRPEIEDKVNAVLARDLPITASSITEQEFRGRDDLRRTLEVSPPIIDGHVRVVAIVGFDEQACGGTHVHRTRELGRFEIVKTENKGRLNKRLYVRLMP